MARQNIDEEWKTDPRRDALVRRLGDGRLADGARVALNWLILDHKGKPVPLKKFKFLQDYDTYIECGLAEVVGEEVHIAGADRYQEFFDKQKENGSKGGRPKTQRKPKKPKETQNNPNEKSETQTKPENPSSSFSISSSFSGSISNSEITNSSNSSQKAGAFVKAYCDRFKLRWGESPQILGKDAGIAKRLAKDLGQDRFEYLLDAFFQMPDSWLVKTKHPLATFETKLNEVVVFAESGKFTTTREAHQADDTAALSSQLQRIREGRL